MSQKISQIAAINVSEDETVPEHLPGWERMQYKSFRKWAQYILSQRELTVKKLEKDFEDGHMLYNLLELLAEKKVGKSLSKAKMRIHCVNNLRVSFEFMQKEGIRLENLGVEDVVDGNLKLIMGLLWTLILKYQISRIQAGEGGKGKTAGGAKNWILDWLKCIAHYRDVKITNLTTSFQDGMAFNAMIHLYNNDIVNYDSLDKKNRRSNVQNAFDLFESEFGVPKLLDVDDVVGSEEPDEKSMMTYLAACISALEKYSKKDRTGGKTDASKSFAWGPGVELASTAEKAWFVIQAKDSQGNKVNKGGDRFKVKIAGPAGFVDAKVTDNQDGTYQVVYYAKTAGPHKIDITLEGKPISNSPVIVEVEYNAEHLNEAYYKWSVAYGAGTEIASDFEPATFTIQAKNKYGNEITKGGDPFKFKLKVPQGAEEVTPTIVDNNNGTYGVTYQIKTPGDYAGDVTLLENSIFNSPFNIVGEHNTSAATQTEPKWCTASGPGLVSADTTKVAEFTITAKNKYGNNVGKGGETFNTAIESLSGKKVPTTIKDNGNGTYDVKYQPTVGGEHTVGVKLNNTHILRSPYSVPVTQKTDPTKSIAFGAGVEVGSTAELAVFTIQAKDGVGNNVNRGGDKVRVNISGPKGSEDVEADLIDNEDGTYTASYQPVVPGVYNVEVKINGTPIFKSPYKVKVDFNTDPIDVADPKWSVAYGAGVEVASTAEVATFSVEARNKYGNIVKKGGDKLQIDVKSASGPIKADYVDNKNGIYSVKYQATAGGNLQVGVNLNGGAISGSPFSVVVDQNSAAANEADARWTQVFGPGRDTATTTVPANLTIQAKNKYGNNVTKGGDNVQLLPRDTLKRLVDSDVRDNGNGSYSASYKPTSSGLHRVAANLNGNLVHKTPFAVKVTQETDPTKSRAYGPGAELASTAEPAVFTIQAVDKAGNLVNRGGDNFKVKISGPEQISPSIVDNNNGTYTVTYNPKKAGDYKIDVTLEGKAISNSPLKVKVEQQSDFDNVADAKWSTCYGAGTEIGSTAEKSEFTIQARNKYGNNIKKGGHDFQIEFQGPKGSEPIKPDYKDNEDGTYTITYQAVTPGSYVGDVTLDSKSIQNSPFKVTIEANKEVNDEADPKWSTAYGPGLESADTISPAPFTIVARNRYGNQLTKGGSDFKLRIKGFRGRPVKSSLKDNNDGTYSATYEPTASGKHLVDIKLDSQSINSFPKPVFVTQKTDAAKTVAVGAGTVIGSTAEVAEFTIQAKDAKGNKCNRGGDKFKVVVTPPAGSPPVEAKVKDNSDGTYTVQYSPVVPGAHNIDVSFENKPISNSPLKPNIELNSAPNTTIEPKWSTATGPGTELASTAEQSEFTIQSKNKYGNPLATGGNSFAVNIKAPEGSPAVKPTIVDNKDGTYLVKYKPFVPGDHTVDVTLNGAKLFETPATTIVEHNTAFSDEADAHWSTAYGAGVESAATSDRANFTIQAKNRYGNLIRHGGDDFRINIKGNNAEVDADIKDNGNGTYSVSYQPTASGEHSVEVTLDDWHIYRSPFLVPVQQGTDASKSFAFGAGVELASTAEPSVFTIQAKDKQGNKVTRGGDRFKVQIAASNGSAIQSNIKDNNNGTYTVTYQPTVAGVYTIHVTLGGTNILNSPYKPTVEYNTEVNGVADAKWSTVSGPGTEHCSTAEPANFDIIAKNKYGNPLTKGGDTFDVKIQGPSGPIEAAVKDNGNGTYGVQYQAKVPGEHNINVTLKNQPLNGCPFKVQAEQASGPHPDAVARFSTAYGPGLLGATTIAPATFTVQAKNKFGNNIPKGGNDVQVDIKGPRGSTPVKATVQDNNDGTYSVTYQPNAGGAHTIAVRLDGSAIQDSPFTVPVSQETDAGASTVTGAGVEIASTAEPASFVIQARDKAGNKCNKGGDPFTVKITSAAGEITPKIKDNRDGTYTVTYHPKAAGELEVEVKLHDKPVGKSPYKVKVEQNDSANTTTDPRWSFAHGAGVELASTAETSEFTIQARNKYGNDIKTGGDPFLPKITSSAGVINHNITDNQNGTYTVVYQPNVPGITTVEVSLKGTQIQHSPYSVVVDKNNSVDTEADARWSSAVGEGLDRANIIEPTEFKIQARNKYGNKVNKGGDNFQVGLKDGSGNAVPTTIIDNGDGTYDVAYQPTNTGDHLLDVTLQDSSINKMPLDVLVDQGTDASKCVPYGPGFEYAIVGEPSTFTVQAKDKNWNNVKNGGDKFEASVRGPNGEDIPVTVTDNKNGTYDVTYTPKTPGYHDVNVTLEGESIAYCPFSVPAKQQTSATKSVVSGPGLESATTTEPAVFTIKAKDNSGTDIPSGGEEFVVRITPPAGSKPVAANIVDNGDGSYTVDYQPTSSGDHIVEVLLNDQLVGNNGNAFTVPVKQVTDAAKSVAYGPGFEDSNTGNPTVFMIRAKDAKGNNVTKGGDPFKAVLNGPSGALEATIKDNNNGTYVATFNPSAPGNHTLEITLNGQHVSKSPATIYVRQDVDASKSIISGPGIESANTVEPAVFTIEARDSKGNKVTRGGETFDVRVTVVANGFPIKPKVKDNKDGTYTVQYQAFAPGNHKIEVTHAGKHVGKSPVTLNVIPGPATVMSEFEMEVWREINKARMDPVQYAANLRELVPNYEPSTGAFTVPDTSFVRQTKEGTKALFEAIRALESMEPKPALKINETFSYSCRDLVADLGPKGAMGNVMSDGTAPGVRLNKYGRWKGKVTEIINYGGLSPKDVVIAWIIDDGVPERSNRGHIFDPEFTVAGIASGPHLQALRMCVVALAGNYLEGEEPEKVLREIKTVSETESLNFDRFLTKDKTGYLIPCDKMYTDIDKVKMFKEGKTIHVERLIINDVGQELLSHFRWNVPFDFEPITVLAKFNSLNTDLAFFITKPLGTIDPNQEVTLTTYILGPTKGRKNDKMDFKNSDAGDHWLFQCTSSSCKEELTIKLKGRALTFENQRTIIAEDEEGEYETISTSTRSINLPYQVPIASFQLQGNGTEGFTLKVIKPSSTVDPNARIEIPIREGYFD